MTYFRFHAGNIGAADVAETINAIDRNGATVGSRNKVKVNILSRKIRCQIIPNMIVENADPRIRVFIFPFQRYIDIK